MTDDSFPSHWYVCLSVRITATVPGLRILAMYQVKNRPHLVKKATLKFFERCFSYKVMGQNVQGGLFFTSYIASILKIINLVLP